MSLENTMLNERSPMQKAAYCTIPSIWNTHEGEIHRDRKSKLRRQASNKGKERKSVFVVLGFVHLMDIFLWMKKFWQEIEVTTTPHLNVGNATELHALNGKPYVMSTLWHTTSSSWGHRKGSSSLRNFRSVCTLSTNTMITRMISPKCTQYKLNAAEKNATFIIRILL